MLYFLIFSSSVIKQTCGGFLVFYASPQVPNKIFLIFLFWKTQKLTYLFLSVMYKALWWQLWGQKAQGFVIEMDGKLGKIWKNEFGAGKIVLLSVWC